MTRLVDVPRSELNIGDRILAKHLNDAMDDYLFTVERDDLPSEPGLYVEANGNEWAHRGDGTWVAVLGVDGITPTQFPLAKAEPRAVTAKAVLDQIQECLPLGFDDPSRVQLTGIAREFGVSS